MPTRQVKNIIAAQALSEGAGVTVHRTIGNGDLRHLDPFLMLDHFGSNKPDEYIAGFPDHPHRGFITLTYMLDGHMLHQDSMGNRGDLKAGGAQWMKAASGVIHSEMPQQTNGLMRGFQLWINLPAAQKMTAPNYQEYSAGAIPELRKSAATVRVLCGEIEGVAGPIEDKYTELFYFDCKLNADKTFRFEVPYDHQCFAYCYDGSGNIVHEGLRQKMPAHHLCTFTPGHSIEVRADALGAGVIFVGGRPIGEEIVQYGPFVMNSREEIEQAVRDFQRGTFVQQKASYLGDC